MAERSVRLWLIRLRGKRTQSEVAEKVGIDRSWYTKIENGASLSVDTAKKIASVLGFHWTLFFSECNSSTVKESNNMDA